MNSVHDYLDQAIAASPRPIIVEIGAARCEDSMSIIERIHRIKPGVPYEYYAIEPDPRNIAEIKKSEANQYVHLVPAAIGDANKRTQFHQSGGTNPQFGREHTLSGSLKRPVEHLQAHPWCEFKQQAEVRMMTLNSFFETFSLPHIDFIWCDVQGAEDLVIAGGSYALAHTRFFYTEYYNNEMYEGQIPAPEIHRRLGSAWSLVNQWPNDILFENLCLTQK